MANTATKAATQAPVDLEAERKRRFLERQAWIDAVQSRRDLSPAARLTGGRLGWHKNLRTGQCNPGYGTLADESGYPVRSAIRAVAELERKGCIKIERTAGGRGTETNSYTLIPQAVTRVTTARVSSSDTRVKRRTSPVSPQHPILETIIGRPSGAPMREKETSDRCFETSDAGRLDGARAEEEASKRTSDEGRQEHRPDLDRRFAELRAIYNRGWLDDPDIDRRAFITACQGGADPSEIVEAAKAHVAAADAPRFLKPLSVWLDRRGFEHKPQKRKPKRERPQQQQRRGAPPWQRPHVDIMAAAMAAGAALSQPRVNGGVR